MILASVLKNPINLSLTQLKDYYQPHRQLKNFLMDIIGVIYYVINTF